MLPDLPGIQMKSDDNAGPVRSFGFRAPRVSADFSFFVDVTATGERYEARCTDISEDGLAAELPQSIGPRTEVTISMLLPGATTLLQVQGSVEYSQECGCGVNFLNLSAEERKQIQRFVQSH
jgi:c-di-GMP-binding flagellar brake protein YcgR